MLQEPTRKRVSAQPAIHPLYLLLSGESYKKIV
jgi:hypothetical protein